jgi:hypothetical protein
LPPQPSPAAARSNTATPNAAVDADPLCASQPDRPGEPIAKRCERVSGGKITFGESKSEPLDLKGAARKDDDPR